MLIRVLTKQCSTLNVPKDLKMATRKMEIRQNLFQLMFNYSQNSSIAGFHYIFQSGLSIWARTIWSMAILILAFFGLFLSVQNYNQWNEEPVSTTITSAGLPISEIEFPSVVICSSGLNREIFYTDYYTQVLDAAKKEPGRNITNMTPNEIAQYFLKIAQKEVRLISFELKIF
jgi:hypothetical protein